MTVFQSVRQNYHKDRGNKKWAAVSPRGLQFNKGPFGDIKKGFILEVRHNMSMDVKLKLPEVYITVISDHETRTE